MLYNMQRRVKRYSLILTVLSIGAIIGFGIAFNTLQTVKFIRFTKYYTNLSFSDLITYNKMTNGIATMEKDMTFNTSITRTVWMLWDKGWDKAPPLQAMCLRSFQRHNADFKIHAMNLSEAEKLINRKQYYTDNSWNKATIQAKSDIIRVELLGAYGGVWADATVYCNEPLSNWIYKLRIEDTLGGFFAYERTDEKVNEQSAPWIASWFLIATTTSRIIKIWSDTVRRAWASDPLPPKILGYYWIHRIFANLTKTSSVFQQDFENVAFMSAKGPCCRFNLSNTKPHVYKTDRCKLVDKDLFKGELSNFPKS